MLLDVLRLLFVEDGKFIASPSLGPQQFVELGMDCLRIPMLGPLDDKGHPGGVVVAATGSSFGQASSEDEERAKVRKAQEVLERTSPSVGQVCLIILTLLSILYTLYFAAGIILPFVLALVLTMVLGPAMRLMNRKRPVRITLHRTAEMR